MTPSRITTVALSAAALGLVIAGCQPQGGAPATKATESPPPEATAADEPVNVITGSEQLELFVGNTIIGALDSFKLTWAEYFASDGTTRTLLRFEGEDDLEVTGTYFTDDQDRLCTEYAEMEQRFGQTVFCNKVVSLGEGRYQQLWEDGARGAIYEQILEGEQLHALDEVSDKTSPLLTADEMRELLVGNTIIGVNDHWNLTWAEYFAPDGTTKLLLRFEGQDDMEATGKHYSNNEGQYCTEDPQQNAYCNNLLPLGDGRYQQVYPGGEKGSIYNQILEGEQLHALDAVSDRNSQLLTVAEMRELLVGNTVIGSSGAWNMTWSEYFAPDGTTKVRFRFEGQDDLGDATGIHYFNSKGQFCTDPEGELGPYCNWILPLGNGKYEQVYEQANAGETGGDIYEQVLEGDQVEAFK